MHITHTHTHRTPSAKLIRQGRGSGRRGMNPWPETQAVPVEGFAEQFSGGEDAVGDVRPALGGDAQSTARAAATHREQFSATVEKLARTDPLRSHHEYGKRSQGRHLTSTWAPGGTRARPPRNPAPIPARPAAGSPRRARQRMRPGAKTHSDGVSPAAAGRAPAAYKARLPFTSGYRRSASCWALGPRAMRWASIVFRLSFGSERRAAEHQQRLPDADSSSRHAVTAAISMSTRRGAARRVRAASHNALPSSAANPPLPPLPLCRFRTVSTALP